MTPDLIPFMAFSLNMSSNHGSATVAWKLHCFSHGNG